MKVPSFLTTPPPTVAVEITGRQAAAIALSGTRGRPTIVSRAVEALPEGLVAPSLTSANVADPALLAARVRRLFAQLGQTPRRVALVLPDPVAKVSLVRLDTVPARRKDLAAVLQFQVRKAAPFSIDEARVAWAEGAVGAAGAREFVVTVARRDVIAEYERACETAGAHAGMVDLATLSLANAVIAGHDAPAGDWLLVHVAPDYSSIAILRGPHVLFFRSRPGDDQTDLGDLVHQTAMYYEDRLEGRQFERVRLAGWTNTLGASADDLCRRLESRLGLPMEPIDPTALAPFADRIGVSAAALDQVAPLVGALMRDRATAPAGAR